MRKAVELAFEETIRAEIFSASRLELHGESLAHAQKVSAGLQRGKSLSKRVAENRKILEDAHQLILQAVEADNAISPAAEWLIDNFHIVREQLKDIRDHLPASYYRELPKLSEGPFVGYPRVFGLAWAFVAHTDSRFDGDLLRRFLQSYQSVQSLTIGELWAVSITLRVVMMENLRRISIQILAAQEARKEADARADELLGLKESIGDAIKDTVLALEKRRHFSIAFVVQLLQRLRFQGSKMDPVLEKIDEYLKREGFVADELVNEELQRQTAANATVRNIITSFRMMTAFNWQDFFEEVSLVDAILREDATFPKMDFATRDRYRHALEELGRHSPLSELKIARTIINLCITSQIHEPGYYLISTGRWELEEKINFREPLRMKLLRFYMKNGISFYLTSVLFLTGILSLATLSFVDRTKLSELYIALIGLFSLFPSSEIALAIINRITIALLGPKHLPRLNLENGIPLDLKTFVVVPAMLTHESVIDPLLEQLEIHYLSNPDGFVHFALLTDWKDSAQECTNDDTQILNNAAKKLAVLNEKHGTLADSSQRFYIFHRKRLFNPAEGKWLGWERKRGKLHEFNRLLRGATDTTHIPVGPTGIIFPKSIRYVITLDADTKLPKGSVGQLVGTMAHSLNKPHFDKKLGRVVRGYGILQPRITPGLPSREESTIFQRLSTGNCGVDPYAAAVSDVYQDLFREGSYTGKGIYDVDTFETALSGQIPENSLLSHDLFEGNFVRCGFLSDVEFFEDFPSHIGVASGRTHRWIRGDWQLIPWILGRAGKAISTVGRWKMFDNLRRSLVIPSLFILFCSAALISNTNAIFILILTSLGISSLISFIVEFPFINKVVPFWQQLSFACEDLIVGIFRAIMDLVLLPYHAWLSLDAIARSMYRLTISHRHMLEWTTAAQAKASASLSIASFWRSMFGGVVLTLCSGAVYLLHPQYPRFFGFFLFIWAVSPFAAQWMSKPPKAKRIRPLSDTDKILLNNTARRIWLFFSNFVTAEDNYLPPDNYQEDPYPVVAHRSSPTNFGLYLLSVISVHDFAWLGLEDTAERLDNTLNGLLLLPRHRGHFYNWYETTSARALDPKYISSVDNGNLAGHLIALAESCNDLIKRDLSISVVGMNTTLELLHEECSGNLEYELIVSEIASKFQSFQEGAVGFPVMKAAVVALLAKLATSLEANVRIWASALSDDLFSHERDYNNFYKWRELIPSIESSSEWWKILRQRLDAPCSLKEFPSLMEDALQEIESAERVENISTSTLAEFKKSLSQSALYAKALLEKFERVQDTSHRLFLEMDFGILYDSNRKLFSIGMRVPEDILDPSYYDLLASEARLLSFIAIAKGDVPVAHWFRLGRGLGKIENGSALLSWSGSMFEYLMPSLVMHSPEGSLLENSCRLSIRKQISYGTKKGVPWGISESAYNKRDLHLIYQYTNFGVPDLGLKRGLGANLVIAPYASILASMFEPLAAVENLIQLQGEGGLGIFGFYDAIDYTSSRLPEGDRLAVVKTYMAHHQGMSLLALANLIQDGVVRNRFHSSTLIKATELLLQERSPRNVGAVKGEEQFIHANLVREEVEHVSRSYHTVNRPVPTTQLLSNGNYVSMITSAGSGYSRYRRLAVSRWREDVTKDDYGTYFFIRDCKSDKVWSATYQPTCVDGDSYEVNFTEDRVGFARSDNSIFTELETYISPEHDAEIRKIKVTNTDNIVREIEITSYLEVVLNSPAADSAHPAFSNLFVQTEYQENALIATRRPRSDTERPFWMTHVLLRDKHAFGEVEFESDRMKFLGRGRTIHDPLAIHQALSKTVGSVLDPIFSLRTKIRLEPGMSSTLFFTTAIAETKDEIVRVAENFQDPASHDRASSLAWTQAQVKLHYLNMEPDEAHLFQRLATRLIYLDSSLRPSGETIKGNAKDVTGLWAHGISGDFPIILIRIDDVEARGLVRQILKAQQFFAMKQMTVDIVIINEQSSSYVQELQEALAAFIPTNTQESSGKTFILRGDLLPQEDRVLLYAEARVILSGRLGSLSEQVKRVRTMGIRKPQAPAIAKGARAPSREVPDLLFFNGIGGFTKDGLEYQIHIHDHKHTPAPWINVVANQSFGFQVSESGSAYTWSKNSRENQLTPWSNDPVTDPSGEAFYFYDKISRLLWSPTTLPIRIDGANYVASHGQGYSRFDLTANGIKSTLTQFVDWKNPVKISRIHLKNESQEVREISAYGYVEWVLGFSRSTMAPTCITEFDPDTQTIFAQNPRNSEHGKRIAFAGFLNGQHSFTGDRTEFLGRNGAMNCPAGILHWNRPLSNRAGASLDPCAAARIDLELQPGEEMELVFILGQADTREEARTIIQELRNTGLDTPLQRVKNEWDLLLTKVQVKTPDQSFDLLLNRWLMYQTIVCRYWSRSAFYQAGGAFGFRDQLQDMMAVMVSSPAMARAHILVAASRQFIEGDVQHWWHPPTGRGVRTHFSDDLLWLPYVVSHYVKATGDSGILEERVSFLEGPILSADQEDSYYTPNISTQDDTLFEHCVRALDHAQKNGAHGLPLMGAGDWNDGMNRVGKEGKGESVWLAWFLYVTLGEFSLIAENRGITTLSESWRAYAKQLLESIEHEAWDGNWYRRAFYDDGTPLGSAKNEECRIDSLAQTWAVISKAAMPKRSALAMAALEKLLIKREDALVLLFTPPFDKTPLDPGYIKGYLPGVRENGGQYTHAAAWCVIAYAMMGDGKRAVELFSLLNPIHHSNSPSSAEIYKIEPYVLAGDVYSQSPHTGRGGWSWYTGSSGWMYRAGLEYILGFKVEGNLLQLSPQTSWDEFSIQYRHGNTQYEIRAKHATSQSVKLDGEVSSFPVQLVDDGKIHKIDYSFVRSGL